MLKQETLLKALQTLRLKTVGYRKSGKYLFRSERNLTRYFELELCRRVSASTIEPDGPEEKCLSDSDILVVNVFERYIVTKAHEMWTARPIRRSLHLGQPFRTAIRAHVFPLELDVRDGDLPYRDWAEQMAPYYVEPGFLEEELPPCDEFASVYSMFSAAILLYEQGRTHESRSVFQQILLSPNLSENKRYNLSYVAQEELGFHGLDGVARFEVPRMFVWTFAEQDFGRWSEVFGSDLHPRFRPPDFASYQQFIETMKADAHRAGIEVVPVPLSVNEMLSELQERSLTPYDHDVVLREVFRRRSPPFVDHGG